jgi:transcriptional regulator with XRE-family HTH domain
MRRQRHDLPDPLVRRALRVAAGLTQSDVAELLEKSRPTVTRYESGARSPRGSDRVRYAELLEELRRGD